MEFLYDLGLFIAKAATIVIAVAAVLGLIAGLALKQKSNSDGELQIDNLSEEFKSDINQIKKSFLSKKEQKQFDKEQKKLEKDKKDSNRKLFLIDFEGDVDASATDSLREEISAIISIAQDKDEVLIRLESPGGVVHGYGLAASQVNRLTSRGIKTTVAVDKVAASGGYMMSCVANHIIAAPFAIIGSIGVIAQLPNFNKLLTKNDIEIEQHTAGEFKRTLTVLGENTDKAREKFKEELQEVHELFKSFVAENRPIVDIDKVATGEHWYGKTALDLKLVDELTTSDDYLLSAMKDFDIIKVQYKIKHNIAERLGIATSKILSKTIKSMSTWSITNSK